VLARLQDAWHLDGTLAGGARWDEGAEVDEPCTAVEFGVDGVDEEWLGAATLVRGLEDDDASDELWGARRNGGSPAHHNGVAGVPHVEDLEWDVRLGALAGNEGGTAIEGCLAEL
jgi:hypothetical protein